MNINKFRAVYLLKSLMLVTLLFFTGCTVYLNEAPTVTDKSILGENQGIVIARVVDSRGASIPFNQLMLTPKNLNASKKVVPTRLSSRTDIPGSSVWFVSNVDAGEYSLAHLKAYHSNDQYWFSFGSPIDTSLGTFEVLPGKITDLGTLIYYPKPEGDKFIKTVARSPLQASGKLVSRFFPFLMGKYEDALGWGEDGLEDDRDALYVSIIQNPVSYVEKYKSPTGNVYFIGALGALTKRSADGKWSFDAINSDDDLWAIAESQGGDLVVGGEQGKVMLKQANSEWSDISLDVGYVVDALSIADDGIIDAIVRSTYQVYVYRMNYRDPNAEWQKMASFAPFLGWHDENGNALDIGTKKNHSPVSRYKIDFSSLALYEGKHYISIGVQRMTRNFSTKLFETSIFSSNKHQMFSYDPKTWAVSKASGFGQRVDLLVDAGEVTLGLKKQSIWALHNSRKLVKKDAESGRWEKINNWIDLCPSVKPVDSRYCMKDGKKRLRKRYFNLAQEPVFVSSLEGYAVVRINTSYKLSARPEDFELKFVKTEDGGTSWNQLDVALPSKYCASLVPQVTDRLLLSCNRVSGDFYESIDFGQNWTHVREHENF